MRSFGLDAGAKPCFIRTRPAKQREQFRVEAVAALGGKGMERKQ